MKKLAILTISTLLYTSSAYAKVVATYSGQEVTDDQVMTKFKPMIDMQTELKGKKFSEFDSETQKALVSRYINMRLLDDEVQKKNIKNTKEFKEKIQFVEEQISHQLFIEQYLEKNVTDKMISDEYEKLAKEMKGQKEIKTSHILLDSEEKAKEIKKKLDKGGKFEELAKAHSKDKTSAVKGGQIGYTTRGQLVSEYETVANSLGKNAISDPVKSRFGWHIIRLEDKRDVKVPSKEEAMQGLRQKISSDVLSNYFSNLEKKANIEYKN